jgi:hypothetical protein
MPYELHIERSAADLSSESTPIRLEEWKAVVAAVPSVRLFAESDHIVTSPTTGEIISFPAGEGDVEVFFPSDSAWHLVFRWHAASGSISFVARFEPGDRTHPVWATAVALASHLGARIQGDDGETYDLETGAVVDE